jgi:hypothetical protein
VEDHKVDKEAVLKLLMRSNKTSCGPDGIPFSLYEKVAAEYLTMWVDVTGRMWIGKRDL